MRLIITELQICEERRAGRGAISLRECSNINVVVEENILMLLFSIPLC